jgi:dUTP pyrophosphatase
MLQVKKLHSDAVLPTVGHPGQDLGFDLYALEDTTLFAGVTTLVRTGIAATFCNYGHFMEHANKFGLLIRDRSSMAVRGIKTSAGVLDAGYTGEIKVLMTSTAIYYIYKGDKIAQMLPVRVYTRCPITEVEELTATTRGAGGFGSTGT